MSKSVVAHYISGTHWDREWYRPFEEYRFLLVSLMDGLIERMERDEAFRFFHMDGQTCLLEDYLEIRPQNRARLEHLVKEGRILIGPWFTMPDLFCVGEESLIRNLLVGKRICREWKVKPMPVGFVCDMFGHPSQMPQIFGSFGYNDVVLGRGTNESTTPPYFWWEGADGSRVFVFKLQDAQGYGAFALPRAALEEESLFVTSTLKEFIAEMESAGTDQARQREVREKHFRIELNKYIGHERERSGDAGVVCLIDSMDHIAPAPDVREYLRLIEEAAPDLDPRHSTLPDFFQDARTQAGEGAPVRNGELREPSEKSSDYLWLIPNCPSARVGIKLANDACESLLARWADPLAAIANIEGAGIAPEFLHRAWKQLLLNHAHDSICGCSIAQVHRDMIHRFDAARTLGEQLRAQAIGHLTSSCRDLAEGPDEFTLTVVNPLPEARREVVELEVDLPLDYPSEFRESFFSHAVKTFELHTASGELVPWQLLGYVPKTNERTRFARYCFQSDGEFARYRVAVLADLPALGFTSLRVLPARSRQRLNGTLRSAPRRMENEFLAVEVAVGGTVVVTDKISGESYSDLFLFEARSEIGDGWFHVHSPNDEQILTGDGGARLSIVNDGPMLTAMRVRQTLLVPARFDDGRQKPSEESGRVELDLLLTLRAGARTLDVELCVDNHAEDFRLKILLPSDCSEAAHYTAHQPFDFVERPISIDPATAHWQEVELAEKPFQGFQAIAGSGRGLAVICAGGAHEGGVADDGRRTLMVTLLRSFRKTIVTGGESEGLEKGETKFRFRLLPFAGELPRKQILSEWASLQAGLFTRQTGKRPSGFPAMKGISEPERSFLRLVGGSTQVTAIKAAETGGGLIVRLFNPWDDLVKEEVEFAWPLQSVVVVEMDEESVVRDAAFGFHDNVLVVDVPPRKVLTLRVAFDLEGRAD